MHCTIIVVKSIDAPYIRIVFGIPKETLAVNPHATLKFNMHSAFAHLAHRILYHYYIFQRQYLANVNPNAGAIEC